MSLSPDQAAENLQEIERTGRRSAEAYEYAASSPQFILWGLIWMAGYAGSYLLPHYGFVGAINWLWLGLIVIGIAGSHILGRRRYRHLSPRARAKGKATAASDAAAIAAANPPAAKAKPPAAKKKTAQKPENTAQ